LEDPTVTLDRYEIAVASWASGRPGRAAASIQRRNTGAEERRGEEEEDGVSSSSGRGRRMSAKFICPACWHSVDFTDDWVGKTVKCQECHARRVVTQVLDTVTRSQEMTEPVAAAPSESRPEMPPVHSPELRGPRVTADPSLVATINLWHIVGILLLVMSPLPWLLALCLEVPAGGWLVASATCFAIGAFLALVGMLAQPGVSRSRLLIRRMEQLGDPRGLSRDELFTKLGKPNGRREAGQDELHYTWSSKRFLITIRCIRDICTGVVDEFQEVD
jgi:DNA-directed RNA polymerase subunit RPC12/RpoP